MNNQLSKAERTRQFIIETTSGIFNMKGYAGTSVSDLTEATGLTKGSIYGNFESKEEVALAVFDYNHGKVVQAINQRMDKAKTYHDKLMVYAQVYDQYSRSVFPKGGCPLLNTSVESDDTNPLLKERAAKAILSWKKKITDLIEAGIAAGEFKPVPDHNQIALSVIALIEGGIMIAKVTNNPNNLDAVLKTVGALIKQLKA